MRNLRRLIRKFFPLDKNYLLEQAQLQVKTYLLSEMYKIVSISYERLANPLGIEDDHIRKIRTIDFNRIENLSDFYLILCGIYRYRFGTNQLELLWDGTDQLLKYEQDWKIIFIKWIHRLCQDKLFIQSVLDLTAWLPIGERPLMAEVRMQYFLRSHFGLKIHRTKGIIAA